MAKKKEEPSILKALRFVALAQRDEGAPYQTHVALTNRTAIAFDGIIAAGCFIDEDITACPHTLTFRRALERCAGPLSVTMTEGQRLSVKSGRFRSVVPCLPGATGPVVPDPVAGVITEVVLQGLLALAPVIVENSQRVFTAAVFLKPQTMVATNGMVIVECWHGVDFPPQGFLLPKLFIGALDKAWKMGKNPTYFGFSDSTLTVYFDDNSWLRTQCYQKEQYPDTDRLFARPYQPGPLPKHFFEAAETVADVAKENTLIFQGGAVRSSSEENLGSSYELPGMSMDIKCRLNAKNLLLLRELVTDGDLAGVEGASYFSGQSCRAVISQIRSA